ncbi:MAG: UDP-N-acetyl glucosamine 2-epimerase [Christensenellales bacterium]
MIGNDRISTILLCPTNEAVNNLAKEGIIKNVYNVGDVMCDAIMHYGQMIKDGDNSYYFDRLIPLYGERKRFDSWYMATIHRAENTDDISKIKNILDAFEQLDEKVIFPVHPRTKCLVDSLLANNSYCNIYFCEPMGYIDMLYFTKNAKKIITDSGGLQKEAYILHSPCVTVRDQTEWVETLIGNHNVLAKPCTDDILLKVNQTVVDEQKYGNYYGDGKAAEKILKIIKEYF